MVFLLKIFFLIGVIFALSPVRQPDLPSKKPFVRQQGPSQHHSSEDITPKTLDALARKADIVRQLAELDPALRRTLMERFLEQE
jgi:hypothetical protein